MNKKQLFETIIEQQLNDLPLPDENQSWEAMQCLLNEDERRGHGGFIKYGGFVLMFLSVPIFFWLLLIKKDQQQNKYAAPKSNIAYLSPEDKTNNSNFNNQKTKPKLNRNHENILAQNNETSINEIPGSNNETLTNTNYTPTKKRQEADIFEKNNREKKSATNVKDAGQLKAISSNKTKVAIHNRKPNTLLAYEKKSKQFSADKRIKLVKDSYKKVTNSTDNPNELNINKKTSANLANALSVNVSPNETKDLNNQIGINKAETKSSEKEENKILIENSLKANNNKSNNDKPIANNDSLSIKNPAAEKIANSNQSIKKPKRSGIQWSSGIGIQQQIPIADQKFVTYSNNGKKNILGDYIPSVYVQAEKPKKWYALAEFNYSAPQSLKELAYSRKTLLSDTFTKMTTTTLRLKKTFYHNLPISFNYYIKPNWTFGLGTIYSILHRSIAEKQTTIKNLQTQQETTALTIIPSAFSDSFLYKSQWQFLFQTSYEWRRFSFGLRYARDLESYIKYTLPNGEMQERKNWSLDCFIRFRLWQTK